MIRTEIPLLIFFYLLAFLTGIFLVWAFYATVRKYRAVRLQRHRVQCTICGTNYEDKTREKLPRCPRCGRMNERVKLKAY